MRRDDAFAYSKPERKEQGEPYTNMPFTVYGGAILVMYGMFVATTVAYSLNSVPVLLAQWIAAGVIWYVGYYVELRVVRRRGRRASEQTSTAPRY